MSRSIKIEINDCSASERRRIAAEIQAALGGLGMSVTAHHFASDDWVSPEYDDARFAELEALRGRPVEVFAIKERRRRR